MRCREHELCSPLVSLQIYGWYKTSRTARFKDFACFTIKVSAYADTNRLTWSADTIFLGDMYWRNGGSFSLIFNSTGPQPCLYPSSSTHFSFAKRGVVVSRRIQHLLHTVTLYFSLNKRDFSSCIFEIYFRSMLTSMHINQTFWYPYSLNCLTCLQRVHETSCMHNQRHRLNTNRSL